MTLLSRVCYQLSPPDGATAVHASKACTSAVGILLLLLLSKAAAAVCELVADPLLVHANPSKNTLAARGLEEIFSSCAVVSVFGSGSK
jgi:hypothetical protein